MTHWTVTHQEWMGGSVQEGLFFHDGSMGKAYWVAWTIIPEGRGWLKGFFQGEKKTVGCPGKN